MTIHGDTFELPIDLEMLSDPDKYGQCNWACGIKVKLLSITRDNYMKSASSDKYNSIRIQGKLNSLIAGLPMGNPISSTQNTAPEWKT